MGNKTNSVENVWYFKFPIIICIGRNVNAGSSMSLEKSCRQDKDCTEKYYCRLSGVQHVSDNLKADVKSLKIISSKVNSQGFNVTSNGTCSLRGSSGIMFDTVKLYILNIRR